MAPGVAGFWGASSTSRGTMRPCGPEPRRRAKSMPASPASRRASGVTVTPPASRAGPKLCSGVRTSKNGSSLMGRVSGCVCGAGVVAGAEAACTAAAAGFPGGVDAAAEAAAPSAITATTAPTGATVPSGTRISLSTPAVVEGTSIETLSVSISNRLSPGFTVVAAATNHLVIFPSATVSPSCGIRTSIFTILEAASLDPFPHNFLRGADRTQDQTVADEFVAAHNIALVAGLYAALAMMRDGTRLLVDRISAEIGDVVGKRCLCFLGRGVLAGARDFTIWRDMAGHMTVPVVDNDALGIAAAFRSRSAVDGRADITPGTDQTLSRSLTLCVHHVTEMYCVSRNSIRPSCAPSRPRPDCLTPPNGAAGSETSPRFNPIMPKSSFSETRMPRLKSLV